MNDEILVRAKLDKMFDELIASEAEYDQMRDALVATLMGHFEEVNKLSFPPINDSSDVTEQELDGFTKFLAKYPIQTNIDYILTKLEELSKSDFVKRQYTVNSIAVSSDVEIDQSIADASTTSGLTISWKKSGKLFLFMPVLRKAV